MIMMPKLPGDKISEEIWQMRALVSVGTSSFPKLCFILGNEDLVRYEVDTREHGKKETEI